MLSLQSTDSSIFEGQKLIIGMRILWHKNNQIQTPEVAQLLWDTIDIDINYF